MKVNLFRHANKELSQDAFLVWLLSWGAPECKGDLMYEYGTNFIQFLYGKLGLESPVISSLHAYKQDARIDIVCNIHDNEALLIEDKVGTKQHDDQLKRYRGEMAGRGYQQVHPLYIQTGEQCDYAPVIEAGYTVITRKDLLTFFSNNAELQKQANNQILNDYVDYLTEIEEDVQSYKTLPLQDWTYRGWLGFYQALQDELEEGGWDYVANPAGGFMGFWWHWLKNDECYPYLQLEEGKLCFKISGENAQECRSLMYGYRDYLVKKGEEKGLNILPPAKLRAGAYTTVAILGKDYRICKDNDRIDMEATINYLKGITSFFDDVMKDFNLNS